MSTRTRRPVMRLLSVALATALLWPGIPVSSAPVTGSDVLYTLDAGFDQGTLMNVNHDAPNNDQLQLNQVTTPFPYVNVAASIRGSMIRINADTGAIVGEYWTSPEGMGRNPSRTTVDQLGNVWVANRDEYGVSGGQQKGSVARIGLIIGGTRVDAAGSPDPAGQYLQPPFDYNTCLDRDSDGLIKTSAGLANILPWTNAGGADTDGGVSTADDECIINYTRVTGTGTRTVAVDATNNVWVGGLGDRDHEQIDGATGQPIPGTQFNVGAGGYGGLIDNQGNLWSARELIKLDPDLGPPPGTITFFGNSMGDYGLGIDPTTGHIWQSSLFSSGVDGPCCRIYEFDSNGSVINSYLQPFGAQGVAVDGQGHVWMAEIFGSRVWHLAPDPANPGTHYAVGVVPGFQGVTGVAVDANGKIWGTEYNGSRASRIDPTLGLPDGNGNTVGQIDLSVSLGAGAGPYNYSDMTGFVAIGSTSPQGTWTVVQDGGTAAMAWGKITWNQEPEGYEPEAGSITVEARAADSEAALSGESFMAVANGIDFSLTGRYIEVRATLKSKPSGSPILSDLRVEATRTVVEVPVDIKPTSCPNPLNVDKKGILPVAVLGTDSFDVTQVDPASIMLEGVAPLRTRLDDEAAPYAPYTGKRGAMDCTTDGPDGYQDLTLKFSAQEVAAALGPTTDGEVRVLQLTGLLYDGTEIVGEDVVVIINN